MARWFAKRRRPLDPEDFPAGPLRDLAGAPPPDPETPISAVELLAVDVETTGLDPKTDHLLSIAWVPVIGRQVVLATAHEATVRTPEGVQVGESATVHRLTDDVVSAAPPVAEVLPELLRALHGRILLAHHAPIELGFLGAAVQAEYGARFPMQAVDTMALQQRLISGEHGEVKGSQLRLDAARRHYSLPRYAAHHALTDAIASAELLLAQAAELERRLGHEPTLADLSPVRSK